MTKINKKELLNEKERLQRITGMLSNIVFEYDVERDIIMNRVGYEGEKLRKIYVKKASVQMQKYIAPEDLGIFDELLLEMREGKEKIQKEFRVQNKQKESFWIRLQGISGVNENNEKYVVGIINKIDEQNLQERDSMTLLYHYDAFIHIVQKLMPEELKKNKIVIVYSDIRHFKFVNDTYGYNVGDELLKDFAQKLVQESNNVLCAARVYSDNFISAVRMTEGVTKEDVEKRINSLNKQMERKFKERFQDNRLVVNTGVYFIEDENENLETAISNANFARKQAKRLKKTHCVLFCEEESKEMQRQLQLIAHLPKAIENGELVVYYQPKVECGTTRVVGAEALIRWIKPDGKFIYPDQFIPVFEQNGCIVDVDYFVYRQVFSYLRDRIDKGLVVVPISMNVSRVHLEDDKLIQYIMQLFDEYKISPELVEFELTENVYIENMSQVQDMLSKLRGLGTKVSMDDFGSGYSSLNVLNKLPIDVLKLDKVFMKNEVLEENDCIIIHCIVDMAKKLHISVLCEGIETIEQSRFLSRVGCDILQGYLYGKPMTQQDFDVFVEKYADAQIEQIHFPLNGSLSDTENIYHGKIYGEHVCFKKNVLQDREVLYFPGGEPGNNIVELPPEIFINDSYTISFWMNAEKLSLWTSVMYSSFSNGFHSVMPRGWDFKTMFRIKEEAKLDEWSDAGSSNTMKENTWYLVTITFNSKNKVSVLYINGQRAGIKEDNPVLKLSERLVLGGDIYQKGFQGYIADFRIYNKPLSEIDIHEQYKEDRKIYQ